MDLAAIVSAQPSVGALLLYACWTTIDEQTRKATHSRHHSQHLQDYCCVRLGPEQAKKNGCFSGSFTREICCPQAAPKAGIAAAATPIADDAPPDGEEPWEADNRCDVQWSATGGDIPSSSFQIAAVKRTVQFDPSAPTSYDVHAPCGRLKRFVWDGLVLRSMSREPFRVADAAVCAWKDCTTPWQLLLTQVNAGSVWLPPPRATVAVAQTLDGKYWEAVRLWRKTPPRVSRRAPDDRPSLYIITIDSVSRSTLRRFMPLTYELLTQEAAFPAAHGSPPREGTPKLPESHVAVNFARYHTLQWGSTLAQLLPMLYGGLVDRCKHLELQIPSDRMFYNITENLRKCLAFRQGVLTELKRSGYKLSLSTSHWAMAGLVRNIKWDRVCPYLGSVVTNEDVNVDMVCIGSHRYFEFLLEWNRDTLEAYHGMPHFLYSHFQGRHRDTDSISEMDMALRDHVLSVTRQHPDLLVVVMADHGVVSKYCDQRAPMMHLLAPRSLLHAREDIAAALKHNWDKVVSPLDMFATLRHLPRLNENHDAMHAFEELHMQGAQRFQVSPSRWHHAVHIIDLNDQFVPRSLFQLMPVRRTCKNAGIEQSHCGLGRRMNHGMMCLEPDKLSDATRAALARHPKASISSDAKFVCGTVQGVLMPGVLRSTNVYHAASKGVCQGLTLKHIEFWDTIDGLWRIRFVVNEGDPPRVFDAQFNVLVSGLQIADFSASQVTRYHKYEKCTPKGVHPAFCVCTLPGD